MRKLSTFLTIAGSLLSAAAWASQGPLPPSAVQGNWKFMAAYSDEFNATFLDTSKWDSSIPSWGQWSWDPANVTVQSGNLHLRMQYSPHTDSKGQTLYYTSGEVKAKAPPLLYGYFEARIKGTPRFPGACPAFWLYRHDPTIWTELDIVEMQQKKDDVHKIDTTALVFISPDPSLANAQPVNGPGSAIFMHAKTAQAPWDPRADFHTYGLWWGPKHITWYIDGQVVHSEPNLYWHQPLDVVLSMGLRNPLQQTPSADGFPTEMQVDYIRVWQEAGVK